MKRLMKQNFYRTLTLWRMQFWRNRYGLLCWLIALGLFTSGYVPAFEKIAEDQGLQGMYLTMKNPAMIAMWVLCRSKMLLITRLERCTAMK
ncbi:MAG TPA: hypothetical protein K8W13_00085 [Enterococcus columbae]|nr:hypothetical protein [Enterococcus columbae]